MYNILQRWNADWCKPCMPGPLAGLLKDIRYRPGQGMLVTVVRVKINHLHTTQQGLNQGHGTL